VTSAAPPAPTPSPSLKNLATFFLKLGTIAFGGPAAHIAIMEDELVRRRQWIARAEFLDLLALANLLPGPSSTELAIFIGYRLRGFAGLLLAGICFILPAFLIVAILAGVYVRYGSLPAVVGILYGIKPVVIAIILQALVRLGKVAIKTRSLAVIGLLAFAACFAGITPLFVMLGAVATGAIYYLLTKVRLFTIRSVALFPIAITATPATGLLGIFLIFLKLGCIVFGSGYVLLAFLRSDLVIHHHWLSESQLLDAVAVGQVTPGPVFTTATFIGYILAGPPGAVVATIGIFAPAFVFVAGAAPLTRKLRNSNYAGVVLDNLNVASLALMAFVTCQLARTAIIDWPTFAIAIISATLLLTTKLNSTWLIAGGALLGLLLNPHNKL
jgi:chromate transporter